MDAMMQEHTYRAVVPRPCTGFVYNGMNARCPPAPNLTSVAMSALGRADAVIDLRQWTPCPNHAASTACRSWWMS
jgi:hypothetical protein